MQATIQADRTGNLWSLRRLVTRRLLCNRFRSELQPFIKPARDTPYHHLHRTP
jgi:hypothetical protein